jgi:short-subunit dehydrogenase
MWRKLRDRAVLLTGASRGIGKNTAKLLAQRGARLMLTARSADEIESLTESLRQQGAVAFTHAADLTDPAQREAVVADAVEKLGGLDILINNAGLASFGHFDTSTEAVLRQLMEINFFVPAELMRLCLPHLARGRQPAIVNVSSICGKRGIPAWPEHCASKFALNGLTEALRAEFARFDVAVLIVSPGVTRADDLNRHLLRNEGRMNMNFANAQPPEKVARKIVRTLEWNWPDAISGWTAMWIARGERLCPWLLDWILERKVRQLYGSRMGS